MASEEQSPNERACGNDDLRDAIGQLNQRSSLLNWLKSVVDAHSIISITDVTGHIVHANDRFCEISKFAREELIGQTQCIVHSDYHPPSFYDGIWKTIQAGKTWTGDFQNKAKDGSLYWVKATISPIFDKKNQIIGYGSVQTDVTNQRKLVRELQDNEKKAYATLKSAIDVLDAGVSVFDRDGKVIISNEKRMEMYPEAREALQPGGTAYQILERIYPDATREELEERTLAHMTTDVLSHRELSDGRHARITRARTPEGGMISVHTDISDLVQQKKLAEEQAAAMDLMKAIAVDANESVVAEATYATCLERICGFTGWEVGHVYLPSNDGSGRSSPTGAWYFSDKEKFGSFKETTERTLCDPGVGLPGRVFENGTSVWLNNVTSDANFPRANAAAQSGIVGGAAFPVKAGDQIVAVLEFYSSQPIEPSSRLEEILSHVGTQMGRVSERDQAEKQLMTRVAAELERWDKRLVEQNQRFNAALENMSQGLCMFDSEQRLIVCNERYSALYGLPAELIQPGTTLSEIVQHRINNGLYAGNSPESYIQERQDWAHTKSTGRKFHHLNDGRTIAVSKQPLPGGGWVSTHEDITDRQEAEKALQESRELSSKAFRASPAAMAISNPEDGSHIDVNETWTNLLGYSHEDAMALSAVELGIWANSDSRENFVEQITTDGSVKGLETKFRAKDGRVLDVIVSGERLEVGGEMRLLVVSHDITERKLAEKALIESQELFSKAFQLSPVALAISNPDDGSYFDVNDAWTEMFGYSREEARESTALQLGIWADPNDRKHLREKLRSAEGSVREFESTQKTKDGNELNVLIYCGFVEVRGEMLLFFAIHDITERKRAEAALRESKHSFKTLIETLNVVPWRFDPATMRFTYVGPQAVDMFGYPVEDWYQENFWTNIIHPDDREQTIRICVDATERCEDHDFEYRVLTADGGEVWVRDVVSVFAEDGKATELRGILIDISDRKSAERALRGSEQRFRDIAEVSSDWIWECDEQLRFTYFTERFFEITGVPTKELLGRTRIEVGRRNDANWKQHIADLEARRPFRDFRYSVKTRTGQRHWSVSGRPVFDESGNFRGYRGTGADQTSEVEAEQELIRHRDHLQDLVNDATAELKARAEKLRQALEKEKELNELQRQFVSMASHEFRTPLAIIDSAAQRLQRNADKAAPADVDRRVEKIRNAVGRMTRLMESTLIAARLDAGRPTIQLDDCNIAALIRETCARQQDIAEKHTISCQIDSLPDVVTADAQALEQIFTNLLSNAVKYAPDSPNIHVNAQTDAQQIVVSVRDCGVGIDEDDLPNMFQRFFRARTSTGIAGTGIGLNLVKTLVELHGGSIWVESKKGEGSLFTVRLPISGPEASKETKDQAA